MTTVIAIANGYDSHVQLTQLAYFLALADQRHFTRAAQVMNVAQPSLSQQIAALERDLGATLFNRTRGNVTLTDAGEALLPVARRILTETETARRVIEELDELATGRIRLGATPSLCTGILPSILAAFRAEHPGVEIVLFENGSRDLERLLAEGALDLALIIDSRDRDESQLSLTPLFLEELVVISRHDAPSPTRDGERLDVADLDGRPMVMFREGYDLREVTMAACQQAGFRPRFAIEGGEMDAVLEFVAAGMGYAVVPSTVVGARFRMTQFREPGLTRTVELAHRRDRELPRAARALADTVADHLADAARSGNLPPGTRRLLQARVSGG